MAQPNNRQNGDRPNGAPDPNFNWRGLVLFAIAITLIGGAFIMKQGGAIGGSKEVTYPEFMDLLKAGKLITDRKEYPVELVSTTSSANQVLRAYRKTSENGATPPERIHAQVNLFFLQENLYKQLEEFHVTPVQREDSNLMAKLISRLPIEQQEVIKLAFYQGMSQRQVAAHTGKPLGTVKTRIELGLNKLRSAAMALGGRKGEFIAA